MTKTELIKRYIIFLIGLFIVSMGISIITKADLGTSPISSIPYVLSLGFDLSLGEFTILFSILLIIFQIMLLGKNFKIVSLLQIPVSFLFGYFIDLSMLILRWLDFENYIVKIVAMLIGCFVLALGVYMEVVANVVMLPGESFIKSITDRFHTDFGTTKVCCDTSMALSAIIISFVMFHGVVGVREGTVISAILAGFIVKLYRKMFQSFENKLLPKEIR